jgi:hypothetical protein
MAPRDCKWKKMKTKKKCKCVFVCAQEFALEGELQGEVEEV